MGFGKDFNINKFTTFQPTDYFDPNIFTMMVVDNL